MGLETLPFQVKTFFYFILIFIFYFILTSILYFILTYIYILFYYTCIYFLFYTYIYIFIIEIAGNDFLPHRCMFRTDARHGLSKMFKNSQSISYFFTRSDNTISEYFYSSNRSIIHEEENCPHKYIKIQKIQIFKGFKNTQYSENF